jgi:hypothetical protein
MMTGTLVTIYYVMDVVLYLWYCYVIFRLLSLNSHSLGFLVTTRKVIFRRSCLGGTWLGWRAIGLITG